MQGACSFPEAAGFRCGITRVGGDRVRREPASGKVSFMKLPNHSTEPTGASRLGELRSVGQRLAPADHAHRCRQR